MIRKYRILKRATALTAGLGVLLALTLLSGCARVNEIIDLRTNGSVAAYGVMYYSSDEIDDLKDVQLKTDMANEFIVGIAEDDELTELDDGISYRTVNYSAWTTYSVEDSDDNYILISKASTEAPYATMSNDYICIDTYSAIEYFLMDSGYTRDEIPLKMNITVCFAGKKISDIVSTNGEVTKISDNALAVTFDYDSTEDRDRYLYAYHKDSDNSLIKDSATIIAQMSEVWAEQARIAAENEVALNSDSLAYDDEDDNKIVDDYEYENNENYIHLEKGTNKATVKAKDLKYKAYTFKVKTYTSNGQVVEFNKLSGSSKIKVSQNGKIKVKKGTKKGIYKAKATLYCAAIPYYNEAYKTIKIKVVVK